ncbi:HTH-type transcriptional regulator VirS [Asticcacaulis sp. MM231]|uniref:AraC family transcriptional regulator ligand-binding domain-containing protein n=1 Tax=Asticcacaulis sp. MM231 TaxID=3157666 RepID=UPI0032D5A6E4
MLEKSYIRSAALSGFVDIIPTADAFEKLMVTAKLASNAPTDLDHFISNRAIGMMLEKAALDFQRPTLGMDWAHCVSEHLPNLGPVALMIHHHETVGQWLKFLAMYWKLHTNGYRLDVIEASASKQVIIRLTSSSAIATSRQYCEHKLKLIYRAIRLAAAPETISADWVAFDHPAPKDHSRHERYFGETIRFGQAYLGLAFKDTLLKMRIKRDPLLSQEWMRSNIQSRLSPSHAYDYSIKVNVEKAICFLMGAGRTDAPFIANCLGLSAKALQRRLAEEGVCYSGILEDVRSTMARRLLSDSQASIGAVANYLGYSTTAPFSTAFRRWNNMSPVEFRKTHDPKVLKFPTSDRLTFRG